MFNFGLGELTVLALLLIIFLGPRRLKPLSELIERAGRDLELPKWTTVDWSLVALTVVLGAAAFRP